MTSPAGPDRQPGSTPPEIFLHIGTMKTGTSYLQQVLGRNADALEKVGVQYANAQPGAGRAIHEAVGDEGADTVLDAGWATLVEDMKSWPGRAVVLSNELLSFVSGSTAASIVASLAPSPVTVVVTARDLVRVLPSAWQNKVKHGRSWSFPAFVQSVVAAGDDPTGPARSFWHHHDLAEIVRRWALAAGPERVVVVPVPPTGAAPQLLWERFATLLGVEPGDYDAVQDRRSNLSMGYAETELVRRVNRELRDLVDKDTHRRLVLKYLANEVLRPDPAAAADRAPTVLSPEAHAWAVRRSRELADEVVALGVRVQGPVEELVPVALSDEKPPGAEEHPPVAVSAGIVRAVIALLVRIAELEGHLAGGPADAPDDRRRRDRPGRRGGAGAAARRRQRSARRRGAAEETTDSATSPEVEA